MIELKNDQLVFSFPDVHPHAKLSVGFQRTLRIPDDDKTYPLPPGLGTFPLRHVDDYATSVPAGWQEHGGVMMPMYQAVVLRPRARRTRDTVPHTTAGPSPNRRRPRRHSRSSSPPSSRSASALAAIAQLH